MSEEGKYKRYTWSDARLFYQNSPVDGTGIFTKQDIKEGEKVMIWGGVEVERTNPDLNANFRYHTLVQVDDTHYLGAPISDEQSLDEHLNHSCDPSVWLIDAVTLVARRDIHAGEEITLDQGTWNDEPYGSNVCLCRTASCRKSLTENDWKIPQLHATYGAHFSPYLLHRINSNKQ